MISRISLKQDKIIVLEFCIPEQCENMNERVLILIQDTFHLGKSFWTDEKEYNPSGGETGFDQQETKLPSYWNTSFSKICLGMMFDQQLRFIVISKQADSLYSLIADGKYRSTSLGRDTWKKLLGDHASLQLNCNKEGFNIECHNSEASARIGIVTNNEDSCHSCDSRLGCGTKGRIDAKNTCGNVAMAKHQADNGTNSSRPWVTYWFNEWSLDY